MIRPLFLCECYAGGEPGWPLPVCPHLRPLFQRAVGSFDRLRMSGCCVAGLPLPLASPGRAATRATPTKVAGGPGQTRRSAPIGLPPGQGGHKGRPHVDLSRPGQTHRSAPTVGGLPSFGPYAMANQRAQRRDRSGLGFGAGSSRINRWSYLLFHAQGSRASSMRRGSGMSPFSRTLSR